VNIMEERRAAAAERNAAAENPAQPAAPVTRPEPMLTRRPVPWGIVAAGVIGLVVIVAIVASRLSTIEQSPAFVPTAAMLPATAVAPPAQEPASEAPAAPAPAAEQPAAEQPTTPAEAVQQGGSLEPINSPPPAQQAAPAAPIYVPPAPTADIFAGPATDLQPLPSGATELVDDGAGNSTLYFGPTAEPEYGEAHSTGGSWDTEVQP
jgi:hypothetical protein